MSDMLSEQKGDYNNFLNAIGKQYIEVQIWSDVYLGGKNSNN